MSVVCYYVRADEAALDALAKNPAVILEYPEDYPPGCDVLYIDAAYYSISWLASALKRAEQAHSARSHRERDWPHDEVLASLALTDEMPTDDALAAIEGRTGKHHDGFQLGLATMAFAPDRVKILAIAISKLDEDSLRPNLDFELMEHNDVSPSDWRVEGEDIFMNFTLPALEELKAFYQTAAALNQTVLIVWT